MSRKYPPRKNRSRKISFATNGNRRSGIIRLTPGSPGKWPLKPACAYDNFSHRNSSNEIVI